MAECRKQCQHCDNYKWEWDPTNPYESRPYCSADPPGLMVVRNGMGDNPCYLYKPREE